ncbi:MAG: DEAD/DEAH box helicase [Pseudomonadota bacterium]|nr:DEAD/DEAH box helicase [Pseudomonadota bacterium]
MTNFSELALPSQLLEQLKSLSFEEPTPIQAAAIPAALEKKDILGSAQTGTGKTLAFAVPLVTHLIDNPKSKALVLTPTRELALQVIKSIQDLLSKELQNKSVLLIGGDSMHKQLTKLRKRPKIIVGTPGRINDHLDRGTLELDQADFLVLDETDRMLDMGFSVQIDDIVKHMPEERQTLLFSATMPPSIIKVAAKYLQDPTRIAVGSTSSPAKKIKQTCKFLADKEKYDTLIQEIQQRQGSIIIFVKTKIAAEKMAIKLTKAEILAEAIHGNLRQGKRSRVINSFRKNKFRILVATDVAARGLDIPHIEHVINYDLPQCPEDYIHRIGRTARAGSSGEALSFVTPATKRMWNDIDKLINPNRKSKPQSFSKKPAKARAKKDTQKFYAKKFSKKPKAKRNKATAEA